MPHTLIVLWDAFRRYRGYVLVLVILGFLSALLEGIGINAAIPLLSFLINGTGVPTDAISISLQHVAMFLHIPFTFRTLLYFILGLFVLRAFSTVLFGYVQGWIVSDFFYEESRSLLGRTLRASWGFFVRQKTGTLQNILVRDVQRTSNLLLALSQTIQSFSGFCMYLVVALNISFTTTIATFVGGGVLLAIIRPLMRRIQHTSDEMAFTEKDIAQVLSEQITGMKSIKAAVVEPEILKDTTVYMETLRRLQVRIAVVKAASSGLFQPFTLFFIIVAFYVSYHSPNFTLVSFGATLYLIQKMFTYLESGQAGLHVISELIPYAESIVRFKRSLARHEEKSLENGKPFIFTKELRGERLVLSYQDTPVLHGVTFGVRPGEMLALIGPSGAGKTSLTDLILRLFEPTEGKFTVDGVDAHNISLTDWRSRFAYVSQDPFLFNGTIEDNIKFFRPQISEEDIVAAAKEANIYDFVMSLPEGFKTGAGDRGIMLSGGQRQRVVLARALAGRPNILVLDEATSALDSDSEQLIQQSIRNLHGSVTVIVIAHRLSTVQNADKILVFDKGRIVEEGSPDELRKNPDSYFAKHTA